MDDSTLPAVLTDLQTELADLSIWLRDTPDLDLATAAIGTRDRRRALGGPLLEAGLARDGHSPGVRCLSSRFGTLFPFRQAAVSLDAAVYVHGACGDHSGGHAA